MTDDISLERSIRATTERPSVRRARALLAQGVTVRQWDRKVQELVCLTEAAERAARESN